MHASAYVYLILHQPANFVRDPADGSFFPAITTIWIYKTSRKSCQKQPTSTGDRRISEPSTVSWNMEISYLFFAIFCGAATLTADTTLGDFCLQSFDQNRKTIIAGDLLPMHKDLSKGTKTYDSKWKWYGNTGKTWFY